MKLRTELPHTVLQTKIDSSDKLLLVGSCFTEHIGQWLTEVWLDAVCNPWGILFNPASIAQSLNRCMDKDSTYMPALCMQGGQICSFDHHSSIHAESPEQLMEHIREIDKQAQQNLTGAQHLLVTWGTAWVYEREGRVVANCHKAPATEFVRRRMSVEEIVNMWCPIIEKMGKHIIFTVSPIRHLGDGLHGNQLSKATLLLAIDILQQRYPDLVEYLPVYELYMDDLRDYRFYADDLVHPAPLAIEAVKELLYNAAFTPRLQQYMKEAEPLARTLRHRPSNPNAPAHLELLQRTLKQKETLMKKYLLTLGAALCCSVALAQQPLNPFLNNTYAADPSAHVYNDTLWVYPSHDKQDAVRFDMEDYHVYSTTDMQHWQDHGIIFNPLQQTTWAKKYAWAPDCVERNGKFYLYYPTDTQHIGVAVSNRPDGPFTDPLGHPLISIDTPGVVCDRDFIDPCVFIDDDGQAYLYVGQNTPCCVKLNEDMISYQGEVHILEGVHEFFEAIWMHKHEGKYYLSYSDGPFFGHQPRISYCMADNPLGPFTYQGVILDPVNSGTNHHSIVEYQGKNWLFYHTADLSLYNNPFDHTGVRRSLAADPLYYNEDGTIQKVHPTHHVQQIACNTAAPRTGAVNLTGNKVKVGGTGTLYFEEVCGNEQAENVILLHGHSLDRRMWDEQLAALHNGGYHVIRVDLRGYGFSSDQVEGEAFTHADDVVALMDSLQIRQAHIVGLSMGAFIAGDLLALYPNRLLSCTLASGQIRSTPGPSTPEDSAEWRQREQAIAALLAKGIDNYKKEWIETLLASGGTERERMRKPITRMVNDWGTWQPLHHEARCYYAREAMDSLKVHKPEVPTLFLRGATEWKEGQTIRMMNYLPHSRLMVLPNCGHMMNMDQPEAFNKALLDFFQSLHSNH